MEKKEDYILISGASSGFGEACAHEFSKNGWNLILCGRRNEKLQTLKKEILSNFPTISIEILSFDIQVQKEVKNALNSLSIKLKSKISILINSAGLAAGRDLIQDGNISDWEQMIDTNVKGLLYLSKEVIPFLIKNKKGHIVNISSIAGREVYPMGNVYCASKHAVDAISKSMRIDLLPHNIKVTNIAPGAVETEFSLVRFKGDEKIAKSVYEGFEPLIAKDIAETIYFVCSRPTHVTINDLTIMPTAQASAAIFEKK
jgi:NADP-dependent 3-hydroxy acid dehydrogenase YdfG